MNISSYSSKIVKNLDYTKQILTLWKSAVPYIQPFYAIKSCPDKELLQLCSEENIGFDYTSKGELEMITKITHPENTIFANPTKSVDDIMYSIQENHHTYVVDSIEELIKIREIDSDAEFVIRILSNEMFSSIKFNSKFGVAIDEFTILLDYLYQHDCKLKGISYHLVQNV